MKHFNDLGEKLNFAPAHFSQPALEKHSLFHYNVGDVRPGIPHNSSDIKSFSSLAQG